MRPHIVTDEVHALSLLDLEGLRAAWRGRHGPPPPLRSVELLRLMLAWSIQAAAQGGLDGETPRRLQRRGPLQAERSEEPTSELQSIMRISSAVFRLKKKN